MHRTERIRHGYLWALIGLATAIAFVPWQGIIWDGGFPNVECRLKFVDGDNKPVPGVNLTVFTKAGGVCHFYPVDEFVPNRPVTSDAEGRMVFHHSSKFLEFAGHEYSNLVGMRFGETSAPHYDCVFALGTREVFRTPFNYHRSEWAAFRQPAVTRLWQRPLDVNRGAQPDADFDAWRDYSFDTNRDGIVDREECTAAGYFQWYFGRDEKPADRSFLVVERTIVIQHP